MDNSPFSCKDGNFPIWAKTGCLYIRLAIFPITSDRTMAQARSKRWCCVPFHTNRKQKQPCLSFHSFPQRVYGINQSRGMNDMDVCSMPFCSDDLCTTTSVVNRIQRTHGALCFSMVSDRTPAGKSVLHDLHLSCVFTSGALDAAPVRNWKHKLQ